MGVLLVQGVVGEDQRQLAVARHAQRRHAEQVGVMGMYEVGLESV